jgi:unsaturated chondroitin disaccharide hydrolase
MNTPDTTARIEDLWRRTLAKLERTSREIGSGFPHASTGGRYDDAAPEWWTSGFWPGMLWLLYRETQDERYRVLAEGCEVKMDRALWEFDEIHHDVGFMWGLASVPRHRFFKAQNSRRRAMLAASILASRFNLKGRFIRAWNENYTGWMIIDCLMNLPLLHWASEVTGDPRFRFIAEAHADTALARAVDADGACRHILSFDPHTGAYLEAFGGQGYSPVSAWSRGASWGLHGFALNHRYTGNPAYLDAARKIARFFIANLNAKGLPAWDFRAPKTPDCPLDSSAGACAASGLLELSRLTTGAESREFYEAGLKLVFALDSECGAWDLDEQGLLRFGTGHKPANRHINVSLIYGDFFFLEALTKLRGRVETLW